MKRYTARCVRSGDWWGINVVELEGVYTQARRLDQVEAMARDAIALVLDVAPTSFGVDVKPELDAKTKVTLRKARDLRSTAEDAERVAAKAWRHAVTELLAQGLTVREVGHLLGVSYQRVAQLTKSAASKKGTTSDSDQSARRYAAKRSMPQRPKQAAAISRSR